MKAGVLLTGCGVYDGSEIQESVLTLLALEEAGIEYQCYAPHKDQMHVINHLTGEEMPQTRNMLSESARIARGNIQDAIHLDYDELDALVLPGGFGTAKNITNWAIEGAKGHIDQDIAHIIRSFVDQGKPVLGLCMSATTIAKALEGTKYAATLTVGSDLVKSPYNIHEMAHEIEDLGHFHRLKDITEVAIDDELKIITAPCYMVDASLLEVRQNIKQAIEKLAEYK